jgi:hypothetical protein
MSVIAATTQQKQELVMDYYKLTQNIVSDLLVLDKLPKYVDGGYPLAYWTKDGDCLCAVCATDSLIANEFTGQSEDPAVWVEPYHEGPTMHCNCGAEIESAYGDPDAEIVE